MKIYNGTSHPVTIVNDEVFDSLYRKWVGGKVSLTIPPNKVLNVYSKEEKIETPFNGIPIYKPKILGYDPLPKGYDIVIVSKVYAEAHGPHPNMYTVYNPVHSYNCKTIVGCRGLKRTA